MRKRRIINLSKDQKRIIRKAFRIWKETDLPPTIIGYVEGRIDKKRFISITHSPDALYCIDNFGTLRVLTHLDKARAQALRLLRKYKRR